ncbi:MAG: hypothetical protein E7335_07805 [Clostridiales bacterium]|nr:hypothetical protein [Clostridiales bacterium]
MKNTNAIHAMGNGSFLIYGQGPDLIDMHGSDYSMPGMTQMLCEKPLSFETARIADTNNWEHSLKYEGGKVYFRDTLSMGFNTFRRTVDAQVATTLKLNINGQAKVYRWKDYGIGESKKDCLCILISKGTTFFVNMATHHEYRMFIFCEGCASLADDNASIRIEPGKGEIVVVCARTEECEQQLRAAVEKEDDSTSYWRAFLDRITAKPSDKRLAEAVKSVAIFIKAQQSRDGGVAAGHFYMAAYVRDQAGTARGLIRIGLLEEAKAILTFWKNKYMWHGDLKNAESMGDREGRLQFSNDEVEVPAYIILTAFAYYEASGDDAFMEEIHPMLEWAAHVQIKHVVRGMTGFSGDETYVAGGTYPRCYLYHGSAESTMLFILSVEKYMAYYGTHDVLDAKLQEAKSLYRENFFQGGQLMANCPEREKDSELPRFHFGWCDSCIIDNKIGYIGWLERTEDGLYRCPDCMTEQVKNPIPELRAYSLSSVALLPAWHGFDFLTDDEQAEILQPFLDAYKKTHSVTSRQDESGDRRALGYDYALLLGAMTKARHPLMEDLLSLTLDILDEVGTWAEYYIDNEPFNCRCRPWESAINLAVCLDAWDALNSVK